MNEDTVTMKNSVNKSLYSKGFLAMIRDRSDVTVAAYQYEVKMNAKKISKSIKSASKYYKILLSNEGLNDIDQRMTSYEKRLENMYNSEAFKAHNIYPSTNVSFVYAVIAMCLC